jgi:hypothetical protein
MTQKVFCILNWNEDKKSWITCSDVYKTHKQALKFSNKISGITMISELRIGSGYITNKFNHSYVWHKPHCAGSIAFAKIEPGANIKIIAFDENMVCIQREENSNVSAWTYTTNIQKQSDINTPPPELPTTF